MDDDDFFDDAIDDAALAAALEAAERPKAQKASASSSAAPPPRTTAAAPAARNVPTPVIIRNDQGSSSSSSSNQTAATKQPGQPVIKQPEPRKIAKPLGFSSIVVSTRQKGNPILSFIKQVPWEYGDIVPDYVMGPSTCALFLSLKYHRLHPEYIYQRLKLLGHSYNLRILLVLCDTDQHPDPLVELTKTAFAHNLTLMVSWSASEAGGYIEAYKRLEHTPPTQIKERAKTQYMDQVIEFATTVPGVNRTDAMGLISMFGSVRNAINATGEQLSMIPGWGAKKVDRWTKAMREPLNPGKEEEAERRLALNKFTSQNAPRSRPPLPPPPSRKEVDQQAIINARLGIGSVRLGKKAEERIREDAEVDEDAIIAAAEAEAAESSSYSSSSRKPAASGTSATSDGVAPASSGTTEGVMAALARLRQS